MENRMNQFKILICIQVLALWPVWRWYTLRVADSSDEPWGLLALGTAFIFLYQNKNQKKPKGSYLILPTILMLLYGATFHMLPPLIRAVIAVTSIACTVSICRMGKILHLGVWGLFLMSLPIISSLQFYLGFPLRVVVGKIAAPLVQLSGLPVVLEGTMLNWCGKLISIDAPCSGVKMLWVGFYLAFTLVSFYKLRPVKTCCILIFTLLVVICSNILRATALFYVEAGVANFPPWTHEVLGLHIFLFTSLTIVWISQRLHKETTCEALFSSSLHVG